MCAWSCDWTTPLLLRKTLFIFHFIFDRLLKQYLWHYTGISDCRHKRYSGIRSVFNGCECSWILILTNKEAQFLETNIFVYKKMARISVEQWMFGLSELVKILPRDLKCEYFAKATKICKILVNLPDKELENLKDHYCPKTGDVVDPLADEKRLIYSRYPFRHNTTVHCAQSARKNCLVTGQCSIFCCKVCNVKCIVTIYENESLETIRCFSSIFIIEKLSLQGI